MDIRKFLLRQGLAVALSLAGVVTNAAFEEGLPPTLDEAHAFLAGTFERYPVVYVAGDARRVAPANAANYFGVGCVSELTANRRNSPRNVIWSAITSVQQSGDYAVEFVALYPTGNFRLYFPNERATRSAANAFEVLRSACAPPPVLTARR